MKFLFYKSQRRRPLGLLQVNRRPQMIPTRRSSRVHTSEQEEDEGHDGGVSEVQDGAGQACDLQLGEEVMNGVDQEVDSSEAAGQEGAPLPVVVL